jgi:hypothetical protein
MSSIVPLAGLSAPSNTKHDWGQLLHSVTLALVPVLAILGVATNEQLTGWLALGFAVIDPLFSAISTPDKLRAVTYGLGGIAQTALITFGILDDQEAVTVVGSVVTALMATLATFYTPTSTLGTRTTPITT